jgi:hypothetical protein
MKLIHLYLELKVRKRGALSPFLNPSSGRGVSLSVFYFILQQDRARKEVSRKRVELDVFVMALLRACSTAKAGQV